MKIPSERLECEMFDQNQKQDFGVKSAEVKSTRLFQRIPSWVVSTAIHTGLLLGMAIVQLTMMVRTEEPPLLTALPLEDVEFEVGLSEEISMADFQMDASSVELPEEEINLPEGISWESSPILDSCSSLEEKSVSVQEVVSTPEISLEGTRNLAEAEADFARFKARYGLILSLGIATDQAHGAERALDSGVSLTEAQRFSAGLGRSRNVDGTAWRISGEARVALRSASIEKTQILPALGDGARIVSRCSCLRSVCVDNDTTWALRHYGGEPWS